MSLKGGILIVSLSIIGLFLASCFQSSQSYPAASSVGALAPALEADQIYNGSEETTFSLDTYRGKVVLVDFWATWCGPCVVEIPHLNTWQENYAERGLKIIGYTDGRSQDLDAFIKEQGIAYLIAVSENMTENDYGLQTIPHVVLIDHEGKIIKRGQPGEFSEADIEAALVKAGL